MTRLLIPVVFVAVSSLATDAVAAACEDVARLQRPATTVTAAQTVAAGTFAPAAPAAGRGRGAAQLYSRLPAFCRVAATLAPSGDSDIKAKDVLCVSVSLSLCGS